MPFFLSLSCLSPLLSLVLSRMGYGIGPDWQELWKIWQVPLPPLTLSLPSLCVIIDWREVTFKMKSRSVRKNVKAFMLSHGININSLSPPPVPLSLSAYSPLLYPFFLHCLFHLGSALSILFLSFLFLPLCCLFTLGLPECVFASVCWSINKRERERERVRVSVYSLMRLCMCVRAAVPAGRLR